MDANNKDLITQLIAQNQRLLQNLNIQRLKYVNLLVKLQGGKYQLVRKLEFHFILTMDAISSQVSNDG